MFHKPWVAQVIVAATVAVTRLIRGPSGSLKRSIFQDLIVILIVWAVILSVGLGSNILR